MCKEIDSIQLLSTTLYKTTNISENFEEADNIPVIDSPNIDETINLSEEAKTHQDNELGTKGNEYFHKDIKVFLLNLFIEIYLYNFKNMNK